MIISALLFLPILAPAQGHPSATETTLVTHLDPATGRRMTEPTVIERGLHHRVWERIEVETGPDGKEHQMPHRFTELATGMHYVEDGQFKESSEEIEACPGGAVAKKGQHQVVFAENLASPGAITLIMPDGKTLQTSVAGLSYYDDATGKHALIAEVKDCIGRIVPPNQVVYEDAFEGVKASVRYTYTKSGFEQDVIIHERPPLPETFGFSSKTARLRVWTEVNESGNPEKKDRKIRSKAGTLEPDCELDFGTMKMIEGRAFSLNPDSATKDKTDEAIPVGKQWHKSGDGREYLIEEVTIPSIGEELDALPLPEKKDGQASLKGGLHKASDTLQLPARKLAAKTKKPMLMARADFAPKGFVMDYLVTLTSQSAFTLRGDTTYYVNGTVTLETSTFEGGAVLKYASGAQLTLAYPPVWLAIACRPVIFTSKDDNTVGETITGSTGNPSACYAGCALVFGYSPTTISNFRISYATTAITLNMGGNPVFSNGQLVNCGIGFNFGSGASYINLANRNLLFANVYCGYYATPYYSSIDAQNATFNSGYALVGNAGNPGGVSLKNCILANLSSLGVTVSGSSNGFYKCPRFGTGAITNTFNPFQTVAAGAYYLTNGCRFVNAGTTNLAAGLLTSLRQKTTRSPIILSNVTCPTDITLIPQAQRDTDAPDLGYHYDPLDYLTWNFTCADGVQLTITGGTVIGGGNASGIVLGSGGSLTSVGTPLKPNWFVRYQAVQEQSVSLGGTNVSAGLPVNASGNQAAVFQFTKFACPSGCGGHLFDSGTVAYGSLLARNCEFFGGNNDFTGAADTTTILVNNLFWRSPLTAMNPSPPASLALSNNLVYGTDVSLSQPADTVWNAFNNAFDTCSLTGCTLTNGYNAYLGSGGRLQPTNAQDVVRTTSLSYSNSWLGNYYQPANSPLINKGSITADQAGLYHFTTQAGQVKESNSTVDIGYHYVAVDAYGNPYDADGDGIPDYLEDANGNGIYDSTVDFSNWQSSDTDGDGINDGAEALLGRNPKAASIASDTQNSSGLIVHSPIKNN